MPVIFRRDNHESERVARMEEVLSRALRVNNRSQFVVSHVRSHLDEIAAAYKQVEGTIK